MIEIGGYLEFEDYQLPMLHDGALALNCGRNYLAYLIQVRQIKKILLPKYLCSFVVDVCNKEQVIVRYYSVGQDFYPVDIDPDSDEWLYIVNYYGQFNNNILQQFVNQYKNVIIDQTQAYFQLPIYSCRKFLGVPDGAFLYTNTVFCNKLKQDESYQRMNFLLGRYERTAAEFYEEYAANNELFSNEPIKKMSKLTENLLHGIDYDRICSRRTSNYACLYKRLEQVNRLKLDLIEGAYMYPLYLEEGDIIREVLRKKKIYIPTLWLSVLENCNVSDKEYQMAKNILPLPCDQRYENKEMNYIVECILENI